MMTADMYKICTLLQKHIDFFMRKSHKHDNRQMMVLSNYSVVG